MNFEKLKAYLNGKKEMPGVESMEQVPTVEEIKTLPADISDLVVKSQLQDAGNSYPAFGNVDNSKLKNQVNMANEIYGSEYGAPLPAPASGEYNVDAASKLRLLELLKKSK